MASTCNRCRRGVPKFFKYADGDGLVWTDTKGKPHYVYVCTHCGAEYRVPVGLDWDAANPDIYHQVGASRWAQKNIVPLGMRQTEGGIIVPNV